MPYVFLFADDPVTHLTTFGEWAGTPPALFAQISLELGPSVLIAFAETKLAGSIPDRFPIFDDECVSV